MPFLQALGLDEHADERAVRRAYAQRLKRIDQAAEPEAFQALRTDYENALRWLAWKARQARADDCLTEPVGDMPGAAQGEVRDDVRPQPPDEHPVAPLPAGVAPAPHTVKDPMSAAREAAEAVFAEFLQAVQAVFTGETGARQALDRALADDRLVNLEARTFFECRVAMLLMDGWRPGHEFLFGPACDVFHWSEDRRHLELFGSLGAAVDAAINQKLIFWQQPRADFEQQRDLVRRLRDAAEPSRRMLSDSLPLLELLVQRYPQWLHVVTSRDNVYRWREWHAALPPEQRGPVPPIQPAPTFEPRKSSSALPLGVLMLVLFVVAKIIGMAGHSSPSSSANWPQPVLAPGGAGAGHAFEPPAPWMPQERQTIVDIGSQRAPADSPRRKELADLDRLRKEAQAELAKTPEQAPAGAVPARQTEAGSAGGSETGEAAGAGVRLQLPDPLEVPGLPSTLPSRPSYDLLRRPDGAASVPRLGE